MLQPLPNTDHVVYEQQAEQIFSPQYLYDVAKRRALYFIIPSVIIFVLGAVVTALLPAIYASEGKMLIESQEIPSDLVRPTVSTVADERVALLQQRIMVRDKLLAIANKYQLAELAQKDAFLGGWRMSATDIVDMMRARTQFAPAKNELAGPGRRFIAFTVSFENERPDIARQVANEFVTLILNEDVRARTDSALETTRFLDREAKRLENEFASVESKIAETKSRDVRVIGGGQIDPSTQLTMLKAELLMKAASYSESHPEMKALKQKIAVLEKLLGKTDDNMTASEIGLDALLRKRESLRLEQATISTKLAAARLGESLERGQHSERLSVIEQPAIPQKPVRPNRPKILAVVFILAIAAGGGLAFALETFDGTIRRSADLAKLVDSQLIVSIPYITTHAEGHRQKSLKIKVAIACSAVVLLAASGAAFYLLRKFGFV